MIGYTMIQTAKLAALSFGIAMLADFAGNRLISVIFIMLTLLILTAGFMFTEKENRIDHGRED